MAKKPDKVVTFQDCTVSAFASWTGHITVNVECRNFSATGMSLEDFVALAYKGIDATANEIPGTHTPGNSLPPTN